MTFGFVSLLSVGVWFVSRTIIAYFKAKRESDKAEADREREQADWDATARALYAQRTGERPSAVVDEDAWFGGDDALGHEAPAGNPDRERSPLERDAAQRGVRRSGRVE